MKDNELDNLFREALHNLDGAPPQAENWNKESTFDKIQLGLNGDQNRSKHNFFDLAAAVVLTLTAVTYLFSFFITPNVQESIPEIIASVSGEDAQELNNQNNNETSRSFNENSNGEIETQNEAGLKNEFISYSTIETKAIVTNPTNGFSLEDLVKRDIRIGKIEPTKERELKKVSLVNLQLPFEKRPEKPLTSSSQLELTLPLGVAYSAGTVAPVASLNATLNLTNNKATTSQLSLGLSAYGLLEKSEDQSIGIEPVLFAETSFGIVSNNKFVTGHSVGLGYQLNDVDAIQGNAIKLNYTVSLKKRVRVAAEALVSEGMSRIQPGIKLTFI